MNPNLDSVLPASLRTFLYQIGEIEREIQQALSDTRPEFRPPTAATLRQRLRENLAELAAEAQSRGHDPSSAVFQEAWHLMATLADTTLRNLTWWGRTHWLEQPLLTDYPLPDGVPEELSQRLDQLLDNTRPDPALVQVYLLALATGSFPDFNSAHYRQQLFSSLSDAYPELAQATGRLFPSAYRRHQKRGAVSYLPATRRWVGAVLVIGILLLALSAPLWQQATDVARQASQAILSPRK